MLSNSEYFTNMMRTASVLSASLKRECGITLEQFRILAFLEMQSGHMMQSELAGHLQILDSAVSMSVSDLEEKGLLRRVRGDYRNGYELQILADGRSLFATARQIAWSEVEEMLTKFSSSSRKMMDSIIMTMAGSLDAFFMVDGTIDMCLTYIEVSSKSQQNFLRFVRSYKITPTEYRILYELKDSTEGVRQRDIANSLLLKRAQVCRTCKKMEASGLVELSRNQDDARSVLVKPTKLGLKTIVECAEAYESYYLSDIHMMRPGENDFLLKVGKSNASARRRSFLD
ncbi:MAG: MarR family winged helix-turn-helix transcriptional regulator [Coriobacteriales bacterium]|jgi:DNA-binding MarR family transcriptional regulator